VIELVPLTKGDASQAAESQGIPPDKFLKARDALTLLVQRLLPPDHTPVVDFLDLGIQDAPPKYTVEGSRSNNAATVDSARLGQRVGTARSDAAEPASHSKGNLMDAEDFRRIALGLPGAEENSHMGAPDFRVGGRIFATLASQKQGYGNLMLTPEQQAAFVEELPEVFVPIAGGWGRNGATHIRLAAANADVLAGALRTAWKIRLDTNAKPAKKKRAKR
jgi:hypothetical protein